MIINKSINQETIRNSISVMNEWINANRLFFIYQIKSNEMKW